MAFDKKYYREIKKFTSNCINNYRHSPMGYYNMLPDLIEREDYEGAQAVKEVLLQFLKTHDATFDIQKEYLMKIPDYINPHIHCHLTIG